MTAATVSGSDLAASPGPGSEAKYSVVIPVFNGASVVADTVGGCVSFFERHGLPHEIVLVDDASTDGTWELLACLVAQQRNLVAVRLLKNAGQQIATMCGLRVATGDYVFTMDDDLQHDPSAMGELIAKAHQGHDVVFARFPAKRQPLWRGLPSLPIARVSRAAIGLPPGLVASSFRLIRRDVVDRMLEREVANPYVSGLAVRFARSPGNALVEHHPTARAGSTYSFVGLVRHAAILLIGNSALPLRIVTVGGLFVVLASLAAAIAALVAAPGAIPDWAAVVIPLSLMNGVTIFLLGLLGEYVVRLTAQVTLLRPYEVTNVVRSDP